MSLKLRLKYVLLFTGFLLANSGFGQPPSPSLPSIRFSLDDLDAFQNTKRGNWKIAGGVSADREIEGNLKSNTGKGILIFEPGKNPQPLLTNLEFGDLDLELDFLLAKGSSFKILLQNKYEIPVSDMWMKAGNEAVKAPGLWQHLMVKFKAAAFGPSGNKTASARLEEILLNGQPLNITSLAITSEGQSKTSEKSMAPLAIVANKGPFAIRNIAYKTYQLDRIKLSDITFKVYSGLHKNIDTLQTLKPKRTGTTDTLSHRVGDRKSQLTLDGTIIIPCDGDYLFKITAGGGAWFFIDHQLVLENRGTRDFERAFYEKTHLKKGKYPFKMIYSNSDECLILHYEGPQIPWQSLTTPASVRLSEQFDALEYKVTNSPILQRGFMIHHGQVNPYTASVGLPHGNNYAYDMKKYNLLAAWHGRFIDVSNMWRERGEKQMEIPLGARLEFSGKPLIATLNSWQSAWPDSAQAPEGVFSSRGYKLDGSGLPIYFYKLNQNAVEDLIYASKTTNGLTRALKITNPGTEKTYILLAEGKIIEKLDNGGYAIDDKSYYIEKLEIGKGTATIRQDGSNQQLIVPISTSNEALTIKYNIIW